MDFTIRNAVEADLESINDIYNYYVLNSTCTYQTVPETIERRREWYFKHNRKYPIITAVQDEKIIGWASLSRYRTREAYFPTVENSVYIHNENHGKGLGSALLSEIVSRARSLGYHSLMAGISSDQTASIRLHEKYSFTKVAHFKEVGYKFGQWLDVVWYQLML